MADLKLRLQKGRDGPDVLVCVRADGTRTWHRLHRAIPVHDLTHYAFETTLGLRERTRKSLRVMWLRGVERALLAELLGCSEQALHNLMRDPKPKNL